MSTSAAVWPSRHRNRKGPQHISGRGGYSNSMTYRRETPEPEPSNSSPVQGLYKDPHTALMMCSFMGTRTTVKTSSSKSYKGHLIGFSEKGDIAMSDACLDNSTQNPSNIIIPKDKFVVCKTDGVDLKSLFGSSTDFTDSGIVNRINGTSDQAMRELQPWQADDEDDASATTNSSLSLDDQTEGWDSASMFQANREKFNVKSTYSEDLHEYTTKLPDPNSEGYEERQKFAQKHADEIERSEAHQSRIAKELSDGDEELQYSAVHRGGESNAAHRQNEFNSSGEKNQYTNVSQRGDNEQTLRNGTIRGQNRGMRQNSSSSGPSQQGQYSHHQSMQMNTRHMNSHFHGPPPQSGPLIRNQGPSSHHQRQQAQQNHSATPSSHQHHQQYQQQPPPPHPSLQQNRQPSPTSAQQQLVSPGHCPGKPHPPQSLPQNIQSALSSPSSSLSQPPPSQVQRPPPLRQSPPQTQPPTQQPPVAIDKMISSSSSHQLGHHVTLQTSADVKNDADINAVKISQTGNTLQKSTGGHLPASTSEQKVSESHISASSSSSSLADAQQAGHTGSESSSPATVLPPDRRISRGAETSPEEREKIGQSLHDFQRNFVLESNGASSQESVRQEDTADSTQVSTSPTLCSTAPSLTSETPTQLTEPPSEASPKPDKREEESSTPSKSKLNPNAKEFKPKSQPAQIETQSPSPQPHSSPITPQIMPYPQQAVLVPYPYIVANQLANTQRKRVSLGANVVSDLTAHQVTGQPLLATQPPSVMYLQPAGQPLPATYQFYSPQVLSPRMVAPSSMTVAQPGQVTGLEPMTPQNQPQPVFMTTQQTAMPAPMPAHLHPQPAHAQPMPHPSPTQPAHIPNPAPSPVQQHNSQNIAQSLQHHMSQGPPQSATPQPGHYSQMTINYAHGIPAAPRTSASGQQAMAAGHPAVSFISAPHFPYNGGTAQYTFAPVPQPQTSQNPSHGPGPQPQYVVMPQPSTQCHPPLQHTAQPYAATGIPLQPQQHLMQGPSHMPPSHNPNPNLSSPHLIHTAMPPGIQQQVSGTQPGMYMQVPSTLQQYQQ